jgi:hypothetical protein
MKIKDIFIAMVLSLLVGGNVQANFLSNPGFEAGTGAFTTTGSGVTTSTLNQWFGFSRWQSVAGASANIAVDAGTCTVIAPPGPVVSFPAGWSGNNFAQYLGNLTRGCDQNDKLMQGVSGSLAPSGTKLVLSFNYINQDPQASANGQWYVCGINSGESVPLFFGGSDCAVTGSGADTIASGPISQNAAWTNFSTMFTMPATYDAIVVVLKLGGRIFPYPPGGTWGVDDVSLALANNPPDCSAAAPSVDTLWSPNHKFVAVNVLGVTDPDGDPVTITIDGIRQDEPVNGLGDGDTSPDGAGVGTDTASVRAERAGNGNGRVYTIDYTAMDDKGATCSGDVTVSVPKNQGKHGAAVDDGPTFDSTTP